MYYTEQKTEGQLPFISYTDYSLLYQWVHNLNLDNYDRRIMEENGLLSDHRPTINTS